jgi:hypothetical protein
VRGARGRRRGEGLAVVGGKRSLQSHDRRRGRGGCDSGKVASPETPSERSDRYHRHGWRGVAATSERERVAGSSAHVSAGTSAEAATLHPPRSRVRSGATGDRPPANGREVPP